MSELVADVVAAVKSARARHGYDKGDDAVQVQPGRPPYDLGMDDLRALAERHFDKGHTQGCSDGYRTGHEHGKGTGDRQRRIEDVEVFVVAMGVVEDRLAELISAVAGEDLHDEGKDPRTKREIKQVALDKADEIRAGVVLLALKLTQEGI